MTFEIEKKFSQIIKTIFSDKLPKKIAVAVSGGIDSIALLVLLQNTLGTKTKIFCLTVDHKIRKNSHKDALFVQKFCQKNSIDCTILESYLENPPEVDIENSLREVRYNLLKEFCQKNKIQHLFVAHHNQDLAENFLIRLFRGSGIDGLAAMNFITAAQPFPLGESGCASNGEHRARGVKIIRPLLEFSKANLQQYLQTKKIKWVEDESNKDEKYLRNKIRQFLQTLPDYEVINNRVALASNAILEAKNILDKKTKKEFPKIFKTQLSSSKPHLSTRYPVKSQDPFLNSHCVNVGLNLILDIQKFSKLEKSTATRYLSFALMQVSGRVYKPRLKKLERIYNLIIEDKLGKKEEFYGCFLQKTADTNIIITQK